MTSAGECDSPWVLKLNRTGSRGILGRKDLIGDLTWGDAIWSTEKLWRCAYIYVYIYIYIQLWTISIHGHQSIFILHVYMCVWENYGEHRGESKCIGIGYIVIPQYFHHSGKAASWSSLRPFPSDFQISQVLMFFVSSRIQTSSTRTMPPCLPHVHTNTFTHGPVFLL